ncbi:MAG: hypothetical protein IKN72_03790 [Clostridia bacterium]|nr:hypothetical protein [Clostridia bacterium]
MNQRERLIGWIMDSVGGCARHWAEVIADGILERGGLAPPCKVGDELFAIFEGYITTARVIALYFDCRGGMFDLNIRTNQKTVNGFKHIIFKDFTFDDYGKKLFRTVDEIEQAVKERDGK